MVVDLAADLAAAIFKEPVKIEVHDEMYHTSVIDIQTSERESHVLIDALREPLNVIFNANGKANGRHLSIAIGAVAA
ncbi:MAG TPA: hypothetical protein VMF06_16410 [Candidatus Limnocylindria bacterium]|nr:hypothetical protein [Candidatus Limnocylindria bacterium]